VLFPTTVESLGRCLATADAAGLATIPVGNGTGLGTGRVPQRYDIAVSTRRMRRILAHEAADMTVSVEAGITVAELNDVLVSCGQWLPIDPPHPEWTTIGALIASDAAGPLRLSQGKVRDLLIGITVVLADGTVVRGGGRVVKNVAGYDLMKLFTGSFGTLGIIAEACFKIRPQPAHQRAWTLNAASCEAAVELAREALAAPLMPLYVMALDPGASAAVGLDTEQAVVVIGAGGSAAEIGAHEERIRGLAGKCPLRACDSDGTARLYAALRDFPAGESLYGCRISALPGSLGSLLAWVEAECTRRQLQVRTLMHVGNGVATLRFGLKTLDDEGFVAFAEALRPLVAESGGWVVYDLLPSAMKERIDPWGSAIPGMELMRGVKRALDPRGRLSPGRFVGGI
jgi:glycolate oxidase FAD binding subunit